MREQGQNAEDTEFVGMVRGELRRVGLAGSTELGKAGMDGIGMM